MLFHVSLQLLLRVVILLAQAASPGDVLVNNSLVPLMPVLVPLHVVKHFHSQVIRVGGIDNNHVRWRAVKAVDTFNTDRRIDLPLRQKLVYILLF